jgi:LuxR family maltose regulon positive regulatory protein
MSVFRNALIKKIRIKAADKNIFITAPGGYGKTTIARQWLNFVRGKSAWLTMGDGDNNPSLFYERLMMGLLKLTARKRLPQAFQKTGFGLDAFLEILSCLPAKHRRRYLIIDDLHTVKNENILNSLPLIVKRMPEYIRVCFISRSQPLGPLIETDLLEVLTQDDLLFSHKEIEWLGIERGIELTSEQIQDLLKTTGGWAMYLSALLHDGARLKAPKTLIEYLEAQVWKMWDEKTRTLLLSLAIPAKITPQLAERLTGQLDGYYSLEQLIQKENVFLSLVDEGTYRFHDIFREFLLERTHILEENEMRRLNDVAAKWHFAQGTYNESMQHYVKNLDHDGINSCISAVNRYQTDKASAAKEFRDNIKQYLKGFATEFIAENPYLALICSMATHSVGEAKEHLFYIDIMRRMLPKIAVQNPDLAEIIKIHCASDFRMSMIEYCKWIESMMPSDVQSARAKISTITMLMPLFHKATRDFSEFCELKEEDLKLLDKTLGAMIGDDFKVIRQTLFAGICYEKGKLLDAAHHALNGYQSEDEVHPEIRFCTNMILASTLYAMGAFKKVDEIMAQTKAYLKENAHFLISNFKALQTEYAIRNDNTNAAKEWLDIYTSHAKQLPFRQIRMHFTTLRSYIALKNFKAAIKLGCRMQTLATEYNRPLDKIESKILTAIALWHSDKGGEKTKAAKQMTEALKIAKPYGFVQLFVNEDKEILPLLWLMREKANMDSGLKQFAEEIADKICDKHNLKPDNKQQPHLSTMRRKILEYLNSGMSYNQIAQEANIAYATVKVHIFELCKQLNVNSAEEAVIKAKMLGLTK